MNVIDAFHQRLRVESAVFVADSPSMGREICASALRRGIAILEARLAQLDPAAASQTVAPTSERVIVGLGPRGVIGSRTIVAVAPTHPGMPRINTENALEIIDLVIAEALAIDVRALRTKTKVSLLPRQVAMFCARMMTDLSSPRIARHYGLRDHTTVLHSAQVVEERAKIGTLGVDLTEIKARVLDELQTLTASAA